MDQLIESGIKTKGKFTVDPRPIDYENVKCNPLEKLVFSKIMYAKQAMYEEQLKKVGLKDSNAFSCAAYLPEIGNTPKEGDVLSWAESSAVVFANSVLGARCNRNSGMIELFGSILDSFQNLALSLMKEEKRNGKLLLNVRMFLKLKF